MFGDGTFGKKPAAGAKITNVVFYLTNGAVSFSPAIIDAIINTTPAASISIAPAIIPTGKVMREP